MFSVFSEYFEDTNYSMERNQRYFLECSYHGGDYFGWQKQPRQISVQETIEDAFTTILGRQIEITGCGRTDTGVHARGYVAHFNYDGDFPPNFLRRFNKFLPKDIAVHHLYPVHWDAHARFDAYHRAYEYHLIFAKDPFKQGLATYYSYAKKPVLEHMQAAAEQLLQYEEFFPFCKSNHQAKSLICDLKRSEWVQGDHPDHWVYHIASNRFLRGMVRLIVGMCINVGTGKVTPDEVREAMERQKRLKKSTSAPPEGLYLTDIRYPYREEQGEYESPKEIFTPNPKLDKDSK